MLLAIDSGNTNIAFAVYDETRQRGRWRIATDSRRTADEYAVWLTQLMALQGLRPADIDRSILASVVPGATPNLRELCRRYLGGPPLVVGEPGVDLGGLPVRVDQPAEVGADRLVNAVAAYERYGGPAVVVDFGTATTFDVIGADGGYDGGIIAPGIHASMDALHAAAAKLPGVAVQAPPQVIGKATVPAIQSGVFWGYIGLIEGLLQRIAREQGQEVTVIATGGLAPLFEAETPLIHHVDLDLTLRGLVRIDHLNRSRKAG